MLWDLYSDKVEWFSSNSGRTNVVDLCPGLSSVPYYSLVVIEPQSFIPLVIEEEKTQPDMMEFIIIPNPILKLIIYSQYKESKVASVTWNGEKQSQRFYNITTYIIMRACRAIVKAKMYTI